MKLRQIRWRVFRIAIPLHIMRKVEWQKNDLLDISINNGELIIKKSKNSLNKLLNIGSSYMITIPVSLIDKLTWSSGIEIDVKKCSGGISVKKSVPLSKK